MTEITPPAPGSGNSPVGSPTPEKGSNGLGLASMIVGIVAAAIAFIPIVGIFLVWVPALVALGLGIAAVVKKNAVKGTAIAGLVLSVASVVIAISSLVAAAAVVGGVAKGVADSATNAATPTQESATSAATPAQGRQVVYEVTGDGTATVSYSTWSGGSVSSQSASGVALPWSTTVTQEPSNDFGLKWNSLTLSAIGGADESTISCKVTVDGKVVSEHTASGSFALATCMKIGF